MNAFLRFATCSTLLFFAAANIWFCLCFYHTNSKTAFFRPPTQPLVQNCNSYLHEARELWILAIPKRTRNICSITQAILRTRKENEHSNMKDNEIGNRIELCHQTDKFISRGVSGQAVISICAKRRVLWHPMWNPRFPHLDVKPRCRNLLAEKVFRV